MTDTLDSTRPIEILLVRSIDDFWLAVVRYPPEKDSPEKEW